MNRRTVHNHGKNYRFPSASDHIDIDAFLGALGEDGDEPTNAAQGATPDLSSLILERVGRSRPFVRARAQATARLIRFGAAGGLCCGVLALGAWLLGGGIERFMDRGAWTAPIDTTEQAAALRLTMASGAWRDDAGGSGAAADPARIVTAATAAISGLMRSTVPSDDGRSGAQVVAAAVFDAATTGSRAPSVMNVSPRSLATAAARLSGAVFARGGTLAVNGEPMHINEADLEELLERDMLGMNASSGGAAGVFNPR